MLCGKKFVDVADRLRRWMAYKNVTTDELADILDISGATLRSAYLSGRSMPGGELLARIAGQDIDLRWLLLGVGIPPDPSEEEVRAYIRWLKNRLEYWENWLHLLTEAKRELAEIMKDGNIKEVKFRFAAEPETEYKTKRNKKKCKLLSRYC